MKIAPGGQVVDRRPVVNNGGGANCVRLSLSYLIDTAFLFFL